MSRKMRPCITASSRANKLLKAKHNATPTTCRSESRTSTPHNHRYNFREARGIGSAALKACTISSERMKTYWVYIMSNKARRLYVGFTSKLPWRVFQHKYKLYPDTFTARYEFHMLVWCEPFGTPSAQGCVK
jgi:hypothetical protein